MNQAKSVFELIWLSVELGPNNAKHRKNPDSQRCRNTPISAPDFRCSEAYSTRKSLGEMDGRESRRCTDDLCGRAG